ncbi:MAG: protein kinase [Myxococcaceae bacterium]|nr:protein kinase [Myxococcaceae bacterium]
MAGSIDQRFEDLQLTRVKSDVALDATLAPAGDDYTVLSGPRTPTDLALTGSYPRLHLATPGAAADDAELVPVQVLGEGGMGRVLLARQQSLGRDVAVKVLKKESANEEAAEALVLEARTAGSLEHPGIVPVYALARDAKGLPAVVMKRVDGVNWRELLQDDEHPAWARLTSGADHLEANLQVLIQVCTAVEHAHSRGVLHRDIKPANVLIGELGEVYVADWGVAVRKANIRPGPRRLVGTPAYLAPEMMSGDATAVDERTDVYLLGAALHEVLTQRPPHEGKGLKEVLEAAHVAAAPSFGLEVPVELAAVCSTAMAKDPARRFQSALELRDALKLFLAHRGSNALVSAARARLAELEALDAEEGDEPSTVSSAGQAPSPEAEAQLRRWYALVSECRFGFTHALQLHTLNADAHAGMRRLLEVAARREVKRGATASARAFLAELKKPPADLAQAVAALQARDAERAANAAKLRKLSHELNPSVAAPERTVLLGVLGLTIAVLAVLTWLLSDWWFGAAGRWAAIANVAVPFIVYVAAMVIGRKALWSTRINRQLSAVAGLGCGFTVISRVLAVLLETPLASALAFESVTLAGIFGVCASVWHWSFVVPGAVMLGVGAVGCGLWPQHAINLYTLATAAAVGSALLMLRLWRKTGAELLVAANPFSRQRRELQ